MEIREIKIKRGSHKDDLRKIVSKVEIQKF